MAQRTSARSGGSLPDPWLSESYGQALVVRFWNGLAVTLDLPKVRALNERRRKKLANLERRYGEDGLVALARAAVDAVILHAEAFRKSEYRPTFDWFIDHLEQPRSLGEPPDRGIAFRTPWGKVVWSRRRGLEKNKSNWR